MIEHKISALALQFGVFLHKPRNLMLKCIGDGAGSAGQLGQLGLKIGDALRAAAAKS
jgi:hypothetical protein